MQTNEIEQQAKDYFARIEAVGGMLRAIERGWVQQEIQNAAYKAQQQVDSGEAVVVGVNRFTQETEVEIPTQRIDDSLEWKQVERVRALRLRRDQQRWQVAIEGVTDIARSGGNLMPAILQAVECSCTVGEISGAMRAVFGEYQEAVVV